MHLVILTFILAITASASAAHIRLPFFIENRWVLTDATIELSEKLYGNTRWWEQPAPNDKLGEAIRAVLSAIRSKDKDTLFKLCDKEKGQNQQQFEQQASNYFQQFEKIELQSIPNVYELDGLVVAFLELKWGSRLVYSSFVFTRDIDGSLHWLPYRTNDISYYVVEDWFEAQSQHSIPDPSMYVSDAEFKSATYRFPLVSEKKSSSNPTGPWGFLYLRGSAIDEKEGHAGLAGEVRAVMDEMKVALKASDFPGFLSHVASGTRKELEKWYGTCDEKERNEYITHYASLDPSFVFDASPLIVVYTKKVLEQTSVLYFTRESGKLVQINSSRTTVEDRVFEARALLEAAALKNPFEESRIK